MGRHARMTPLSITELAERIDARLHDVASPARTAIIAGVISDAMVGPLATPAAWDGVERRKSTTQPKTIMELKREVLKRRCLQMRTEDPGATLLALLTEARDALTEAEACMSIVEPRSDKAEYLRILGVVRAVLAKMGGKP